VGRPKEHDQQTATALLEAAERTIEQHGIDALSVRGVAAAVGTTTRAVYSVFGSKEGLVAALGARAFDVLGAQVRGVPQTKNPTADLVRVGMVFRRFAIKHPSLFAIGVQRTEGLPKQSWAVVHDAATAAFAALEERIHRLHEAGLLGERTVRSAAVNFHAYCEGMAAAELRPGDPAKNMTMEQLWVDGLTALLRGFQTPTTPQTASIRSNSSPAADHSLAAKE
jgi:AcrR family transcriptional regulator